MVVAFMYSQVSSESQSSFQVTTFKRITETSYEVQGRGNGVLYLKNIDSNAVTQETVTLPYILNHSSGERYEISVDNTNWKATWGIDIPLGAYLERQRQFDFRYNNYMEIDFFWANNSPDATEILFGRMHMGETNFSWMVSTNPTNGKFGMWLSAHGVMDARNLTLNQGWNNYKVKIAVDVNRNVELVQILNGVEDRTSLTGQIVPYTLNDPIYFRIGREYSGEASRFAGKIQFYKHGDEIFNMNGSGSVIGSNGLELTLNNGASRQKL